MQTALRTLTLTSLAFVLVVLAVRIYGTPEQSAAMAAIGIVVVLLVNAYYVIALRRL